jgi:hypothetical protein
MFIAEKLISIRRLQDSVREVKEFQQTKGRGAFKLLWVIVTLESLITWKLERREAAGTETTAIGGANELILLQHHHHYRCWRFFLTSWHDVGGVSQLTSMQPSPARVPVHQLIRTSREHISSGKAVERTDCTVPI